MDPRTLGLPTPPRQMDPNSPYLKDFDQRDFSELSKLYQEGRVGEEEIALATKMAKLASIHPQLQPYLGPILRTAAEIWHRELDGFRRAASYYPKVITHARWASMTNPEKYAVLQKLANQPILRSLGLTKNAVRDGLAFMVYKVDKATNNSKFYEGLVIEEGGGYRVIRRWGRLTDSGETGRVDGANADHRPDMWFSTEEEAKEGLQQHYKTRQAHGYIDAFGPKHRTPDGKALPMGQYPVGLGAAGFGWGAQSVVQCIPALKQLEDALSQARTEIIQTGRSDAVRTQLETAQRLLKDVAHADSTMAQKLLVQIKKPLNRVMGSPRFLPDVDGRALASELFSIINYVRKQTSLCSN